MPQSTHHDDVFREAAQQLFPDTKVNAWGSIQRPQSGGAFVEVFVFVPEEEAAKQARRRALPAKEPKP